MESNTVSMLVRSLHAMEKHKHIYTGILGLSEASYVRMVSLQKKKIQEAKQKTVYQS